MVVLRVYLLLLYTWMFSMACDMSEQTGEYNRIKIYLSIQSF